MVTGVNPRKHGVLFNGLLVRAEGNKPPKIEPWVHKNRLVHVPTLYDIAHGKTGSEPAEKLVAFHFFRIAGTRQAIG